VGGKKNKPIKKPARRENRGGENLDGGKKGKKSPGTEGGKKRKRAGKGREIFRLRLEVGEDSQDLILLSDWTKKGQFYKYSVERREMGKNLKTTNTRRREGRNSLKKPIIPTGPAEGNPLSYQLRSKRKKPSKNSPNKPEKRRKRKRNVQ